MLALAGRAQPQDTLNTVIKRGALIVGTFVGTIGALRCPSRFRWLSVLSRWSVEFIRNTALLVQRSSIHFDFSQINIEASNDTGRSHGQHRVCVGSDGCWKPLVGGRPR